MTVDDTTRRAAEAILRAHDERMDRYPLLGAMSVQASRQYAQALADAGLLAPAPLREVQAEAWDEGQEATLRDFNHRGKRMRVTSNPYREPAGRAEGDGKADCPCARCHSRPYSVMHVCPDCGSKRCARAAHHVNPCEAGR